MLRGTAFFVVAILAWLAAYASGLSPWIGYASQTSKSFGAGGISIVGHQDQGLNLGPSAFLFLRGQQIVIDYDAEIRAGSLWFHVFQPFDGNLGDGQSHYVTESGRGQWTVQVEKTAIYHVTVEPTPARGAGRGWDLSYTVKWGAWPAASR